MALWFDDRSNSRIARAVITVENLAPPPTSRKTDNTTTYAAAWGVLAFADEDIADGAVGACLRAQGPPESASPNSAETINGTNLTGAQIDTGTPVVLVPSQVTDNGATYTGGLEFMIVPLGPVGAGSLRIRGTSAAQITGGTSGQITGISGINGPYSGADPETVHHVGTNYDIPALVLVWAEWNTAANRYEVYQADCPP